MTTPGKTTSIAMLLPCALCLGFIGGMLIGARLVPPDAGLASGAEVLFYGIVGTIIAVTVTVILAKRLSPQPLRRVALVCVALALVAAGWLAWQISERMKEAEARARIAQLPSGCAPPETI